MVRLFCKHYGKSLRKSEFGGFAKHQELPRTYKNKLYARRTGSRFVNRDMPHKCNNIGKISLKTGNDIEIVHLPCEIYYADT